MPVYTIQPGDTLSEIAERFGVTVDDIVRHNGIEDPTLISVGQRLWVPQREQISGNFIFHTVQAGETLSEIARRFGISVQVLIDVNGIDPRTTFDFPLAQLTGQRLLIPTPS